MSFQKFINYKLAISIVILFFACLIQFPETVDAQRMDQFQDQKKDEVLNDLRTDTETGQVRGATGQQRADRVNADLAKRQAAASNSCTFWSWSIGACVHLAIVYAIEGILGLFAYIVGLAGSILNAVVELTIVKMSFVMNPSAGAASSITIAWALFRDIANIFLIFSLLVVGIAVILGIDGYGIKSLLPKIIIVAILINFSLFFCKAVIDFTNIFSLRFYDTIMTAADKSNKGTGTDLGLGALVMDNLRLTTLYGKGETNTSTPGNNGSLGLKDAPLGTGAILLIGFAGSILFVIVAAVFLAASLSLIARFIMLLFLTTLSSLALVALILPGTRKYWDHWLESFLQNAFFAPLYMVLLWASFQIISGLPIEKLLGESNETDLGSFSELASNPISVAPLLINFIIVCGFFVGSLIIAKQLGAYGASGTLGGLNSLRKSAQGASVKYGGRFGYGVTAGAGAGLLRNSVGRLADWRSSGKNLEKLQARSLKGGAGGLWASARLAAYQGAAKSTFEVGNIGAVKNAAKKVGLDLNLPKKGSFVEREEEKKKKFEKRADEFSTAKDATDDFIKMQAEKEAAFSTSDDGKRYLGAEKFYIQKEKDLKAAEEKLEKISFDPTKTQADVDAAVIAITAATEARNTAEKLANDTLQALSADQQKIAKKFNDDLADQASLVKDGGMRGRYANDIVGKRSEFFNGMSWHRREEAAKKISKGKSEDEKSLESLRKLIKKKEKEEEKPKEKEDKKPKEDEDH